ncbi:MAG: cytoplasmic protein [Deltaproteobacteria bacterium]|nr:cytoplasmic protein [Deltaproteobacteria bacterium]
MDFTDQASMKEISVDRNNLYREEMFTDVKIASIRRLIPVKPDGSQDYTRKPIFIGFTQLVSPRGPIPIQFPIEARNLKEAMEQFPAYMNQTIEKMIEDAKELKRQEDSRIIVPGQTPTGKIKVP